MDEWGETSGGAGSSPGRGARGAADNAVSGCRGRGKGCVCDLAEPGRGEERRINTAVAAEAPGRQGGPCGSAAPRSLLLSPAGRLGRRSPARPGPAYRWLSETSRGRARRPRPPTAGVPPAPTPMSNPYPRELCCNE